jgi:hypothetical protein
MWTPAYWNSSYWTRAYWPLAVAFAPVLTVFSGVSVADGVTYYKGISRPTVVPVPLSVSGGVSGNLRPDAVSRETYLIDGELP